MKRRHILALVVGVAMAACARGGRDATARLPADRGVPLHYVALGDSTVEGIGASAPERTYVSRLHAQLREVYPRAEMENLGVAGATSFDVVQEQLPRAVMRRRDLVTLSVGPNDITGRIGVDVFGRNVATIFRTLRARRETVVVATLLPDLGVTPRFRDRPERDAMSRRSAEFNDALRREAKAYGVVVVDLYEPSRAEVPQRPQLVAGDGYHPSDIGYARWADLMWQAIAPLTAH